MAATLNWCEDHGTATGSPAKGTTRDGFGADTNYAVNCNWKNADDTNATAHDAAAIGPPPANSFEKYQYLKIGGTFTLISGMLWTCHANLEELTTLIDDNPNIKLMGLVSSNYATPSTTLNAALAVNFSRQVWAYQGLPVKFSTTGPEGASPTDTLAAAGYTQYLISQLQILVGTGTDGIADIVEAVVWTET